jgi:hypothetical protein
LDELGRDWPAIRSDRGLYYRLALIDLAYHQVGDDGPFQQLEAESRLKHRLVPLLDQTTTVLGVARRLQTRAAPRAELIAALSGKPGVACGWSGLERMSPPNRIDLGHPLLTTTPTWIGQSEPVSAPAEGPDRDQDLLIRRASFRRWLEFWGDNV